MSKEIYLLAAAVDRLSTLVWMNSRDGQHGRNRPASVLDTLLNRRRESPIMTFDTAEEFEAARADILGGGQDV